MNQYKFTKSTDTEHEVTLASHLISATWKQACAYPGDEITALVVTAMAGDGAPVEIAVKNRKGKTVAKAKGEMQSDVLEAVIKVPASVKVGDSLRFEVKLSRNNLKGKSNIVPVFLRPKLKSLKWSTDKVRRGELVTLSAEFENVRDNARAVFTVYEHDNDGAHDHIVDLPADVEGGKASLEWAYHYQEDTDDVPTQEELEEYGNSYNPPEYFFTATVGGVTLGTAQESRLLEFADFIEFNLSDAAGEPIGDRKYILHLPDGSEREGILDGGGYAREEDVPPGPVRVEFKDPDAPDESAN